MHTSRELHYGRVTHMHIMWYCLSITY